MVKLSEEKRQDLISKLVEAYEYYLHDCEDIELVDIDESGCFTLGSKKYYDIVLQKKGK